ncbi:MAG: NAD(P)-dependent oxidoreductase [Thermomicrobiales bacterium]|nr:NAD(P)-dependent oxidoreductase [Thermomicrobiales bacterium]
MSGKTNVLVTGAAGRIGRAFVAEMQDRYDFRLADKVDRVHELLPGTDSLVLDIADPAACASAVQGVDVVLHLAADPSPWADYYESLKANNFDGTYNIFRAAADAGCRRVVYASSVQTLLGYLDQANQVETPVDAYWWPRNMYGVSKCYGEATARMFAATEGISAICVRIGAYERPGLGDPEWQYELPVYVSPRDLNQLFRLCIDAEDVDFAVVHGISNNRIKRLSLSETCELLGYEPVDDGYEVYGV